MYDFIVEVKGKEERPPIGEMNDLNGSYGINGNFFKDNI
jgi:hypothetical protein